MYIQPFPPLRVVFNDSFYLIYTFARMQIVRICQNHGSAKETTSLLKEIFDERIISSRGTVVGLFLWDYVKPLVYAYKPETIDALE